MAFRGDGASGLYTTDIPFSAPVGAIGIWFQITRSGVNSRHPLAVLSNTGVASERLQMSLNDATLERIIEAYNSSNVSQVTDVTSGAQRSRWQFGLLNILATNSRQAYWGSIVPGLSNVSPRAVQSGSQSFTPSAWNQLSFGVQRAGSSNSGFIPVGASLAHAMVFTGEVRPFVVEQLRRGADPREVCPSMLARYWTLGGDGGHICKVSGKELTVIGDLENTEEFAELPRTRRRRSISLVGIVPAGVTMTADDVTPAFGQSVVLTVSGLASDTAGTIEVGTTPQTVTSWSVSGGAGTVTFTYDGRSGNMLGVARNLTLKIGGVAQITNIAYITPSVRSGFATVTLGASIETDPMFGLAPAFTPDAVQDDIIEYETPAGGDTITVSTAGEPSAGPSYVPGSMVRATLYRVADASFEDITFALTEDGVAPGGATGSGFGIVQGTGFLSLGYRGPR